MEYKIIDPLVPESLANQIEACTMWRDEMTWGYRDQTAGVDGDWDPNDPKIRETFQFQHDVFAIDRGQLSPFLELLQTPLHFAEFHTGVKIAQPQRIKVNMLVKDKEATGFYHPPHVDIGNTDAYSMVYYVHDCDGDTVLFDKTFDANNKLPQNRNMKEIVRSTPKKGSAIIFKSTRFHASSNPVVNDRRIIINYVFFAPSDFLTKIG